MRRSLRHCKSPRPQWSVEWLEPRQLLAVVTITTDLDVVDFGGAQTIADLPGHDEVVSLREAVIATNHTHGSDQIRFAPAFFSLPRAINLQLGQLSVTDHLSLTGPGANLLTISGQGLSRVFDIDNGNYMPDLNVAVSHVTISGGRTTGNHEEGGGIRNRESLSLFYSSVSANQTSGYYGHGGGISTHDAMLSLFSTTVSGNVVSGGYSYGGGISTNNHLTGTNGTTISNSTISGNYNALGLGGGVFNWDGLLDISNSTITQNFAAFCGGVASWGDTETRTEVLSSIISGNWHGSYTFSDVELVDPSVNSFISNGHNLVGVGSGLAAFSPALQDLTGITNPGLLPLADNGGTTLTHALLPTSLAMDRGFMVPGLTYDQRGAPFLRSDAGYPPDIGAYEWQTISSFSRPSLVVDTALDESDGDYSVGDLSLREAINAANGFVFADFIEFDTAGVFATPQTIGLRHGELTIRDSVTVHGPAASRVRIDAQGAARVLRIEQPLAEINVDIRSLTMTGGRTIGPGEQGGGVLNFEHLVLTESVVSGNATHGDFAAGGGISSPSGIGSLRLVRSTVSENSATGSGSQGGGIYTSNTLLEVTDSTITGNVTLGFGGGLYSDSRVVLTNSTVSGNWADGGGGGLAARTGSWVIQNSTITNNAAGSGLGSGIVGWGDSTSAIEVVSSIVAGNLLHDVDAIFGNPFVSFGHNLIGIGNAISAFTAAGDMTDILDPGLWPLAYNGGPTRTHALTAESPARDRGSNPLGLIYDQRGAPYVRLVGAQPDIGALEATDAGLPGDFNHDDQLDCADVNMLVAVIAAHTHDPAFDLNNDRQVDTQDLDEWLALAGAAPGSPTGGRPFLLGDANLDGRVDGSDFGIWNTHKFTSIAAWCAGDFNADGRVDGSDFGIWNMHKFTSADGLASALRAPEPDTAMTDRIFGEAPFATAGNAVQPFKVATTGVQLRTTPRHAGCGPTNRVDAENVCHPVRGGSSQFRPRSSRENSWRRNPWSSETVEIPMRNSSSVEAHDHYSTGVPIG